MNISDHTTVPRRRFGRTGIEMPVFSCGGMRYQQSWKDEDVDKITADNQANLNACIRRAVELGINHIETARGYGTSEIQLGRILKEFNRDELIVQTKVGPKETGEEFIATVEKSLANLQLDYVDLLAVHGINTPDLLAQAMSSGGTVKAMQQLKEKGLCRHIGFSTHGPPEVIFDTVATNVFDYMNLHWYFVYENNWPAIEKAKELDVGVFIISPNDKGGKLYEPTDAMIELCRPLTPMQFNDLYCLSRPEVHTLSLGAARPGDFDEHIEGLKYFDDAKAVTGVIAARIHDTMSSKLGSDWMHGWQTGLPSWEDIPGEINLREIIRLWNFAAALDMNAYGKLRYNLLGQGDHWFPGKNAETVDDQAIIKALKSYPFADRVPDVLRDAHKRFFEAPKERLSQS